MQRLTKLGSKVHDAAHNVKESVKGVVKGHGADDGAGHCDTKARTDEPGATTTSDVPTVGPMQRHSLHRNTPMPGSNAASEGSSLSGQRSSRASGSGGLGAIGEAEGLAEAEGDGLGPLPAPGSADMDMRPRLHRPTPMPGALEHPSNPRASSGRASSLGSIEETSDGAPSPTPSLSGKEMALANEPFPEDLTASDVAASHNLIHHSACSLDAIEESEGADGGEEVDGRD